MAKYLILGAGFVAEPTVEYLTRKDTNKITVAGYYLEEAQQLADKFNLVQYIQLDVSNKQALLVVGDYDVVVSLVPAPLHLLIAKACILQKTHMITASYETPEIQALDADAKQAGISIMNEIGLDPGIDHLAAMEIIDNAHASGESIESFVSWCGGIPAPDDNDNPLGYKFSWEPKGAIKVLQNDAVYQHNNQEIKVSGNDLMSWATPIEISGLKLECYPNRVSVNYKDIYGLHNIKDIIRGTLRYQGFCGVFQGVKDLGLMQENSQHTNDDISWKDYILILNKVGQLSGIEAKLSSKAYLALEWLGCFSDSTKVTLKDSPLDTLCELLLQKLQYKESEKDMVVLQHKFVIKKADGSRYFISSVLKEIGNPNGYSAMAKTVGYPAAMAAQLLAEGDIKKKGLILPVSKEIYQPLLILLRKENIVFEETVLSDKEMSVDEFISEL